ncbi:hypothetical protein J5N97_025452 [Dioscorea zingiberensis]|uniref:Uncharacterized protein n=1 Tax=Dioscorea zingiberensis TaxID=325984 RepID=A0A9D5H9W8_9LILI|nr:hypothetical protein J5N97_025452 [Dioscorea zingiberensis]
MRKEWRAISEHSYRNNANEEAEHVKSRLSDERTIYGEGMGSQDIDFCSRDILQQRLRDTARQREELQLIEIELRAQTIARPEIMDIQNSYEAQLKEQLQEREQYIQELELKVEEKDRELRAVNNEVK